MSTNRSIQVKLTKNLLCPIILQILNNEPQHGYEILSIIRRSFGVRFGASTIYPILNKMEQEKFLKSSWNMNTGRPQRIYQITIDGKAVLDYTLGSLKSICRNFRKKVEKESEDNNLECGFDSSILESKNNGL